MKSIRVGIPVLITFAVLAHGAVEPWSESILEIGAGVLLVVWAVESVVREELDLRWNALLVPLGGLVVLGLVQWATGLTVYAYSTKLEVLRLIAALILLFLTIQAFRTPNEWKRFVWFLLSLAFAVSLFGIVQYFTWNGKLYWLRTVHSGGAPFGPFVNRNDFAGFIELVLPLGLALLVLDGEQHERRLLITLFTVFPAAALVLCASRAGIVASCCELVILGFMVWSYGRRSQRWLLLGVAGVIALLASWLGVGYSFSRFRGASGADVSLQQRFLMSRDAWHIFLAHPVAGTGMGTLEVAYPRYQTHYIGLIVNHAHNDYIELLSDGGIVGGAFGLVFLIVLYRRGIRNLRRTRTPLTRSLYAGGLTACTGLLLHELVDFNLHIPSNAIIFMVIAIMTTSLIPEPIPNPRHRSFPNHLPS